jgi:hydroxymethylpyrimidine pyrophosphatase-like HAD family hydrolase
MAADQPRTASADLPLAVDLDGTLIRADLFFRSILAFLTAQPWRAPEFLLWFVNGRAYVKAKIAHHAPPPHALPYDERVVEWLRGERARGRTIVLASASDQKAVEAVAAHIGLFDAVFASDGTTNLKARRKAEALSQAFPQGFVYAGNERADLMVWEAAECAVLVNASPGLARQARARFTIECSFERSR